MTVDVPAGAFQTFGVSAPIETHYRPATCAEVECEARANGWTTLMAAGSDELAFLTGAVCAGTVDGHRRHYTAEPAGDGFVRLTFPAGQPCFKASVHRVPLERPAIFTVRSGDIARAAGAARVHTRPEHWVEEFTETLDGVRTIRERG